MKSIFNLSKGKWPDELVKVVWNHNTVVSRSTGFTPFKLLFGDEAITLEEARTESIRTLASAEDEDTCKVSKDTIEGIRLQAIDHINKYQAKIAKWRDRNVRLKNIKPRHLVLRRIANPETVGKLQLKWEGPFLVLSSSRPGSYRLETWMGTIFQDPGMQTSFEDTMCNGHVVFFFLWHSLPFKRGERFLMGHRLQFSFYFHSPVQYKGKFPPYVKCKDLRLHHRSHPYRDAELKCHLSKRWRSSKVVPKGMQSLAPKSFLKGCRAKMPPK
jgi:hypothetical protein